MANIIKHRGIVESTDNTSLKVKIVQTSACSACSIKGHCSASESKEKIIDIYNLDASDFKVGEQVWVYGTVSMGMQAVLLAFFIPFLIIIVSLFILIKCVGTDEIVSSMISLSTLIPYYAVIYMLRSKLDKRFSFSAEHINN